MCPEGAIQAGPLLPYLDITHLTSTTFYLGGGLNVLPNIQGGASRLPSLLGEGGVKNFQICFKTIILFAKNLQQSTAIFRKKKN